MNSIRDDKSVQTLFYEIRVKGHLDCELSEWFDNLSIMQEPDGITLLTGPFVDQAALYGLLKKLNEYGLPLISFEKVKVDSSQSQRKGE
jgi:hypothetical protein